jgi:hypothetical protein
MHSRIFDRVVRKMKKGHGFVITRIDTSMFATTQTLTIRILKNFSFKRQMQKMNVYKSKFYLLKHNFFRNIKLFQKQNDELKYAKTR